MTRGTSFALASLLAIAFICPDRTSAQEAVAANASDDVTEDTDAEARTRFRVGRALVDTGLFREAHEEFRRGFVLSRRPAFVFNMAECSRALDDSDARGEYAAYLELDPTGPFASVAQERLDELGPGSVERPSFLVDLEREDLERTIEITDTDSAGLTPAVTPPSEGRAWYADWPFWTAVGVVVIGVAVSVGVLASRDDELICNAGCELVRW